MEKGRKQSVASRWHGSLAEEQKVTGGELREFVLCTGYRQTATAAEASPD